MMRTLICGVMTLALQLSAAELTGTWVGRFDITGPNGQSRADRCYMKLKQNGTSVRGTVGPGRSVQWEIQNGKAAGTKITFEARPPEGGRLIFDLRWVDDHIQGEVRGQN